MTTEPGAGAGEVLGGGATTEPGAGAGEGEVVGDEAGGAGEGDGGEGDEEGGGGRGFLFLSASTTTRSFSPLAQRSDAPLMK